MKQRIVTAILTLGMLGAVLFLAPPSVTEAVVVAILLVGAWEWSAFLEAPGRVARAAYVLLIAALLATVSFAGSATRGFVLVAALVWWLAALGWTFRFPTRVPAAVRWLGGIAVLVPLFVALGELVDEGPSRLLFALLLVWVADSGAFFAGRAFGRVKLAPRISPGKTWEGVLGGMAAVALLVLVYSGWTGTDLAVLVPFCLAVAAISVVGDLTVSMFKRTVGLKDSGSLFPGHGGVLDRIDSMASALPLYAAGLRWFGI